MIQITISGNTPAELSAHAATIATLLSGASVPAALSANEQARLRADATVVPPKAAAKTAAEKKAEKEAAKAAEAAEETSTDDAVEETDDDGLGEGEALTHDDVKKLLIEVRTAYAAKEPTIVSKIVREQGKATKITEVDAKHLPVVAAHCRELLKKAKK